MEQTQTAKVKTLNGWLIVSLVLALILVVVLVVNFLGLGSKEVVVKPDTAAQNLLSFINEVYGQQLAPITLKGVVEKNGLYEVTVTVTENGQPLDQVVYLTKDSKLFVPQAINMADALTRFQEMQNSAAASTTDDAVQPVAPGSVNTNSDNAATE